MATTAETNILDLEDLARRYDAQVLREYLLEQDLASSAAADERRGAAASSSSSSSMVGGGGGARHQRPRHYQLPQGDEEEGEDLSGVGVLSPVDQRPVWPKVYDLRPRCIRRLRLLLILNFVTYWAAVSYCCYASHLRVQELGLKAVPPLNAELLGVLVLGTQAIAEFAAATCLTRPARTSSRGAFQRGFRAWDGAACLVGAGARATILLDVQMLPLLWHGSGLLFLVSSTVFAFAIGIFVFVVQLRLLMGLCCTGDHFSYDKPDLFFKGRDPYAVQAPAAFAGAANHNDEEFSDLWRFDRPPPQSTIKVANLAQLSDLSLLHAVLMRLYVPLSCQESQEFVVSITSFSRCLCEDVIQCSVKFFFLLDIEGNAMVSISLLISVAQAFASCLYASTSYMDLLTPERDTD